MEIDISPRRELRSTTSRRSAASLTPAAAYRAAAALAAGASSEAAEKEALLAIRSKSRNHEARVASIGNARHIEESDTSDEEENQIERQAVGFVAIEFSRLYYREYHVTELKTNNKKLQGRKSIFKVGDYGDICIGSCNNIDRYRPAQILSIYQEIPAGFNIPTSLSCHEFTSKDLEVLVGANRKRKSSRRIQVDAPTIYMKLRWLYDTEDLADLLNIKKSDKSLQSCAYAESDDCQILSADHIDDEALVFWDEAKYIKAEKISDSPVFLITHFFCKKSCTIVPVHTVDREKNIPALQRGLLSLLQ